MVIATLFGIEVKGIQFVSSLNIVIQKITNCIIPKLVRRISNL